MKIPSTMRASPNSTGKSPADSFLHILLRLKTQLGVPKDQDVAAFLGLTHTAFAERKKRGSFPEKEVISLVRCRPDLGLDLVYILTGERNTA